MKIKKNDTVKILYGKDSGKTGKVMKVFPKEEKLVVEGMNVFKRHAKGDGRKRKSEIVDLIKPMHVAKVMLLCPSCKKATRIALQEGKRICKKCKKDLDQVIEKKETKKEVKKETKK